MSVAITLAVSPSIGFTTAAMSATCVAIAFVIAQFVAFFALIVRDHEARAGKRVSALVFLLDANLAGLRGGRWADEIDPGILASRYFDLPYPSYDSKGKLAEGLLATDRPHTFKFYGAYTLKSKLGETNFGPNFWVYSGTPLTTEMNAISSAPVYVNNRGDLGRTPMLSQTNFLVYHEFSLPKHETYKFRIDANITNIFNQSTVTGRYSNYLNRNDGSYLQFADDAAYFKGYDWQKMVKDQELRVDAGYNKANSWQAGRDIRIGLKFTF